MLIYFDYTNVIWENYVISKLIEQITFVSCIIIFVRLNAVELCNLETTEFFLIHSRCQWLIHNV